MAMILQTERRVTGYVHPDSLRAAALHLALDQTGAGKTSAKTKARALIIDRVINVVADKR